MIRLAAALFVGALPAGALWLLAALLDRLGLLVG